MEYPTNIYLQFNIQTYDLQKIPAIPGALTDGEYMLYASIITFQCKKGIYASEPAALNFKITGGHAIDSVALENINKIFNGEYPGSNAVSTIFHTPTALYTVQKIAPVAVGDSRPYFGSPLLQWAGETIEIEINGQRYNTTLPGFGQTEALISIFTTGELTFTKSVS